MRNVMMRKIPVAALMGLVALALLLKPAISRADDNAAKIAEARKQISNLKDKIVAIKVVALPLTEAGITKTKAEIASEGKKASPDLGKLIALNIVLAGLEATKDEELKDLAAKEKSLKEWEVYLASLGG